VAPQTAPNRYGDAVALPQECWEIFRAEHDNEPSIEEIERRLKSAGARAGRGGNRGQLGEGV
jgi:hypothetical protein